MRKILLPIGMMVGLVGPLGCGPSPEAATPKSVEPKGTAPPATQQVAASTYDLTPVQEPAGIVGVGRWKNPSATLGGVASCTGLDPRLLEGNGKLLADVVLREVLGGQVDTSQLAGVVALDAPVDVLVALDSSPKRRAPFTAVSLGLVSLERARGAVEGSAVEVAPGMWRVGSKDNTDATCVIAAAAGSAPARLICGERDRDVMALGPYLARNAPTIQLPGADMHGEVRFTAIADLHGNEFRQQLKSIPLVLESQATINEKTFDRAIADAAVGIQQELTALIGDLDKVTFDIGVDSASCFKMSGDLQLKGKASWLAGTISDRADQVGPPPAIFWRLPKDTDAAFYSRGADPARYSEILRTLKGLAEGAMAKANVGKPADRKAFVEIFEMPLSKGTSSVQASGSIVAPPVTGKAAAAPTQQQTIDALSKSFLGWSLLGVDEGPEKFTKQLKRFVDVYTKQAALAVAREKGDRGAKDPKGRATWELSEKEREAREKKLPPKSLLTFLLDEADIESKHLPTMKTVAAPAQLGKSSMAIEIKFAGLPSPAGEMGLDGGDKDKKGKKETITITLHLLLMADDKTTWVAFGTEKDELVKRLLSVKAGAPDASTLASRPGLEPLKNGKLMAGGFLTLTPVTKLVGATVGAVAATVPGGLPPEVNEVVKLLNNLPHRGETPIFLTTESAGGSAPRTSLSFTVPKAAMEDIGALVMGGIKVATQLRP